ncbi:MAG: hypothetical protein POELPBGB_04091 [Bacteroidia bacterium]|nr:hypothetical protein [Bacteroidia bacterium]
MRIHEFHDEFDDPVQKRLLSAWRHWALWLGTLALPANDGLFGAGLRLLGPAVEYDAEFAGAHGAALGYHRLVARERDEAAQHSQSRQDGGRAGPRNRGRQLEAAAQSLDPVKG